MHKLETGKTLLLTQDYVPSVYSEKVFLLMCTRAAVHIIYRRRVKTKKNKTVAETRIFLREKRAIHSYNIIAAWAQCMYYAVCRHNVRIYNN